jgi:hypothetical protein
VTYPPSATQPRSATARLTRGGHTYAAGSATRLTGTRNLPRGTYTLRVTHGGRTTTATVKL